MDRNKAISFMHDLLRMMVSKDGSDLFITTGSPPAMKIDGKVATVSKQNLSPNHTQMLARSIMNDKQVSEFEEKQECNFSISRCPEWRVFVSTLSSSAAARAWCCVSSTPLSPVSKN